MEVFFTNKATPKDISSLDEKEGLRFNVGRHCLLIENDNITQVQVLQFNSNNTVKLRNVKSGEMVEGGADIPISRLTKIERYGVSVYNYADLPEQIQGSSYTWTCTIQTTDRSLLGTILTKIS